MESKKIEIAEGIMKNMDTLSRTDYKAIKFAEGELSAEEYAPIREKRRMWRAEINRLEAELANL